MLPETFAAWMEILHAVAGSVLWLLDANPVASANLRRAAEAAGIHPTRLVFAPKMPLDRHLARHRLADLGLDTLPYKAHTTTSDALWVGLAVLTQIGRSFPARVAASLLRAVGMPEMVVESRADYIARAVQFARDPTLLAEARQKMDRQRLTAPLFDTPRFVRHIEAAYIEMHERRLAGLPPAHIRVPPI